MTKEQRDMLKPGDLVECNNDGHYCITTVGVLCSYVRDYKYISTNPYKADIVVKVESGIYKGSTFPVNSEYFDLVCKTKQPDETEVFSLLSI